MQTYAELCPDEITHIIIMQETHPKIRELGTLAALTHLQRLGRTPFTIEEEGGELHAAHG
jgi:hypothetical protein